MMITKKPVIYLRSSVKLDSFLKQIYVYNTILNIFKVTKTHTEEEELLVFKDILQDTRPVISLAKHLIGDFNLRYSRCFDYPTLTFLTHVNSPEATEQNSLFYKTFQHRNCEVILFDEDVGSGYLVNKLSKEFKQSFGVETEIKTFINFDPKTQEVLDLKDFIYQYSDTSGLVVRAGQESIRVPYMINQDVLEKFASIRPVFLDNFGTFCWALSFLYHYHVTKNKTYQLDCFTQLQKVYKWNTIYNTELMLKFCQEYLKLYF